MNVKKETLDKLSKALEIQKAESNLSELINTTFTNPEIVFKNGAFEINFTNNNGNALSQYISSYRTLEVLTNVKFTKEENLQVRELLTTMLNNRIQEKVRICKENLKNEIIQI